MSQVKRHLRMHQRILLQLLLDSTRLPSGALLVNRKAKKQDRGDTNGQRRDLTQRLRIPGRRVICLLDMYKSLHLNSTKNVRKSKYVRTINCIQP
jgi:hypothetical protein